MLTIKQPDQLTHLDIWSPRYKDKHGELAQPVVLIACYKLEHCTPIVIIEFSKARHLMGQRYAIARSKIVTYPIDSNGKIDCRAVPLSALEGYETVKELRETVDNLFSSKEEK